MFIIPITMNNLWIVGCAIPGPNSQCTELTYYVEWIVEQNNMYGGVDQASIMNIFYFLIIILSLFII